MKKKVLMIAAAQVVTVLLAFSVCSARDWFVRPSGASYGSGSGTTFNDAWSGFSRINWSGIAPGDTLYIAGTFHEKLTVGKNGSSGSLITVRGDYPGNPGVIDVSSGDAVSLHGRTYVALDGITIDRAGANGVEMQSSNHCEVRNCNFYRIGQSGGTVFGIDGRYAQGIYVYNCRFTNEKGAFRGTGITTALGLSGTLATSTIDKCYIYGIDVDGICPGNDTVISRCVIGGLTNMNSHADGIPIQGSRVVVKQNIVYSCTQGIYPDTFDYGSGSVCICDDVTIANNLVYQTPAMSHMNGINCDVETAGQASMKRLKIYNNTVVGVDQYGINVGDRGNGAGRLEGLEIFNNVVVDCGTYTSTGNISIQASGSISGIKIDHNLVGEYRSSRANYRLQGQNMTQAQMRSNGFETHGRENPSGAIFKQYTYQGGNNDFSLASGSPAIGMGANLGSAYNADINGAARGAVWDAGCYSSGSSGGSSSCSYSLSATRASYNSAAQTGTVNITVSTSSCDWTAVSNAAWIAVTSGAGGTGSGTVSYSVAQNTGSSNRSGTITIAGLTFTIVQSPTGTPPGSVTLKPPTNLRII